jgi:1,4-dihydroxy-2-naphthoate octaprenyltransferase
MNASNSRAQIMQYLVSSARPKTLLAVVGPVLLGFCLALAHTTAAHFPWGLAILILITGLLLQISTNLVNDYGDFFSGVDQNRNHGPSRLAQAKHISPAILKRAFTTTLSLALVCGIPLMLRGGAAALAIGLSSLVVAYCYTGGPVPLAYIALGEVLALFFFGPIAVAGTYLVLTQEWSQSAALYGFIPGFISAALMALNNFRDREDDSMTAKKTLAILLGEKAARLLVLAFLLAAPVGLGILAWFDSKPYLLAAAIPFFILLPKWRELFHHPVNAGLNQFIPVIGKFLFFTSLSTGVAYVLSRP